MLALLLGLWVMDVALLLALAVQQGTELAGRLRLCS